jgi:hypothetical protein
MPASWLVTAASSALLLVPLLLPPANSRSLSVSALMTPLAGEGGDGASVTVGGAMDRTTALDRPADTSAALSADGSLANAVSEPLSDVCIASDVA